MLSKDEIIQLLHSEETYRVERTVSTGNMDKFCEAICAFANDLPDSRKKGYLLIGANDDGALSGLKVDDALLKKIAGIRSDGNILPLPVMNVDRVEFPDGDLLVAEYLSASARVVILPVSLKNVCSQNDALLTWQPSTQHPV